MAFSLFTTFNRLVPKDGASRRIATDVVFGPKQRHRLDIYAPRHQDRSLPVLVFVYGGSWSDGTRHNYGFAGRALAAQGFVTVIADYRLVPAIEYPAFLEDVARAVTWVQKRIETYGGDGARMVLAGHSAGAYNAAMVLAAPDYLTGKVRRAIKGFAGLSGPYDFYPFTDAISQRVFGHLDQPRASQPIALVDETMPPVWLGHGTRDDLVALKNTVNLGRTLRAKGVSVRERHYQGLGHPETLLALSRPLRWRASVLADMSDFAHAVVQGARPDCCPAGN